MWPGIRGVAAGVARLPEVGGVGTRSVEGCLEGVAVLFTGAGDPGWHRCGTCHLAPRRPGSERHGGQWLRTLLVPLWE